jgi:hypothetical protein
MTDFSPQLLRFSTTFWFVIAGVTPEFIARPQLLRSREYSIRNACGSNLFKPPQDNPEPQVIETISLESARSPALCRDNAETRFAEITSPSRSVPTRIRYEFIHHRRMPSPCGLLSTNRQVIHARDYEDRTSSIFETLAQCNKLKMKGKRLIS